MLHYVPFDFTALSPRAIACAEVIRVVREIEKVEELTTMVDFKNASDALAAIWSWRNIALQVHLKRIRIVEGNYAKSTKRKR
jgi:hypothetical protein